MKKTITWLLIFIFVFSCLNGVTLAAETDYTLSNEGVEFIKSFESFIQYPVWDNGHYSIGYGNQCNPSDYPNGITKAEADKLFRNSLKTFEASLNKFISANNITLGQTQYDALISFTYNIGVGWLKNTRLSNLLISGRFTAIDFASAIGVWCHVGKSIANGLVTRRVREIQLFLHGDYTGKDSPKYAYVQFDAAGGDMLTDIYFYPVGSTYGMLQSATKKDSMFLGWYRGDGTKLTVGDTVAGNIRVTARWQNPHPAKEAFTDLSESAWYYGYVDDLYNGGVINGYTDGTIRPQGQVTIGEALKMILVAARYPEQSPTPADPYQWASGYRALAVTLGIFEPDEYKDLNQPANRALIARIAAKAMKLTYTSGAEDVFKDTQDPNVLALHLEDIVLGSINAAGDRYYYPDNSITRAEIFAVVSRIMNWAAE